MKPTKGLNLDSRPEDQPDGSYPFGKNGLQFNINDAVTNEPGFERIVKDAIPMGYQCNGIIGTDNNRVIVCYTNNVYSCIKLVNVETGITEFFFTDQTKNYKLNFKVDNYITGQVQRNYLGELVFAFTDKNTFPKFLNFDKPETDYLKDWNLFPECTFPDISKSLEPGGYIPQGSYFCAIRYYKQDGTTTGFSPVSSGIVVTSDIVDTATTAAGVIVDKSIIFTLQNMDLSYDFLEMAVISRVAGVTKAVLLNRVPVLPGVSKVTYTGTNPSTVVSLEEVLVNPIFYDRVHTIGQLNDALYVGKLERTNEVLDMQPYANLVKLFWTSELIDVTNTPVEHKSGQKKGFMHEEVYAFYVRYKLANGSRTIAYHIPGIEPDSTALAVSTVGTSATLPSTPAFKLEDQINTYSTSAFLGVPGAYTNDSELYPITAEFDATTIGGEDLRGQQVRHHKMPSLKWCKENLYPTETKYGASKLDILGLKALNILIPPKYAGVIIGYEILYAKRTLSNMTVFGQGLALYGASKTNATIDPKVYSNGHNWSVNNYVPNQSFLRFHGFDILFNKPGISPDFISAQYKLTIPLTNVNKSYSYVTGSTIAATGTGMNTVLMDGYSASISNSPANNLNSLRAAKYVLNGTTITINESTSFGTFTEQNNGYLETTFAGRLLGPSLPFSVGAADNGGTSANGTYTGANSEAYLVNLRDIKVNVYENFYTQELVSAGDAKDLTDSSPFWGGDVFVSPYTFHTYGILDYFWGISTVSGTDFGLEERGRRVVNRIVCETIANLYTRFEQTGNIYSKWYPNNQLGTELPNIYTLAFNGNLDPNQFGYYRGAEGINDFLPDSIYNPYQPYAKKFPYRVHRGGKLSRENTRSWKTFLALDYYEVQKNMGEIEHIEGMDDRLLIHMTNSLMTTQDKGKLEGGMLTVTLGAGDIFQFEPQEARSAKQGYGGLQSDLAVLRAPIGYIFADVKQGELYIYKDKQIEMLNRELYRFLREYLNIKGKNPYTGNGVTLGWDHQYKRILLTVKNWKPKGLRTMDIISLDGPEDILEITSYINWPNPPIDDCLVTTKGVILPGSVLFLNGRYLRYYGVNNVTPGAESPYSCTPEPSSCETVTDLTLVTEQDPPFAHITWSSSSTSFVWELYEVDSVTGLSLVANSGGSTTQLFQDFDASTLQYNRVYYFKVTAICASGEYSTPVGAAFSIEERPEIIVYPPGSTVIHYHFSGAVDTSVFPPTSIAQQYRLTVNGSVLGVYPTSGSQYIATPGSLSSATIQIDLLDSFGNPVSIPTLSGVTMFDSSLNPILPVVSVGNSITWTGVDIQPSFLTYVSLHITH